MIDAQSVGHSLVSMYNIYKPTITEKSVCLIKIIYVSFRSNYFEFITASLLDIKLSSYNLNEKQLHGFSLRSNCCFSVRLPPTITNGPEKGDYYRPDDTFTLECIAHGVPEVT